MLTTVAIIWVFIVVNVGAWLAKKHLGELNLLKPAHWCALLAVGVIGAVPVIMALS